jgi:hypothetical protein
VDDRRATFVGLPSECAPAVVQRGQFNFDPSTGHHWSERLRVHMPKHQPMASATRPLPSIAVITGLPSSPNPLALAGQRPRSLPGQGLKDTEAGGARARGQVCRLGTLQRSAAPAPVPHTASGDIWLEPTRTHQPC